MPNFEVHKRIGFLSAIIVSAVLVYFLRQKLPLTGWNLLLIPFIIWLYANIPDIDHHLSRLRKHVFRTVFLSMIVSVVLFFFLGAGATIIVLFFAGMMGLFVLQLKHRGITHTFLFIIIASLPLLFINWYVFLLGLTAGLSHVITDRVWSWTKRKTKKLFSIHETTNITVKL